MCWHLVTQLKFKQLPVMPASNMEVPQFEHWPNFQVQLFDKAYLGKQQVLDRELGPLPPCGHCGPGPVFGSGPVQVAAAARGKKQQMGHETLLLNSYFQEPICHTYLYTTSRKQLAAYRTGLIILRKNTHQFTSMLIYHD